MNILLNLFDKIPCSLKVSDSIEALEPTIKRDYKMLTRIHNTQRIVSEHIIRSLVQSSVNREGRKSMQFLLAHGFLISRTYKMFIFILIYRIYDG